MNESEFENELRALRPAKPSAAVESAIQRELNREAAPILLPPDRAGIIARPRESLASRILTGLCWAASGAFATALAFMFLPALRPQLPTPAVPGASQTAQATAPDRFQEVGSARRVIATEAGGLFYTSEKQPAELVRCSSVERHTWQNPATGTHLEVEVPREDVVLVPVAFQ